MNVIVVDDEFVSLGNFLKYAVNEIEINYKMFQNNPMECLEYAQNNYIDGAFLDINMPNIDGIKLAEKLVSINSKIKIIFITSYTQNDESITAKFGDNLLGFCNKPYGKEIISQYFARLKQFCLSERRVFIKTFGGFDVFVNDLPIKFSSGKSKELLALLVQNEGMYVEMGLVIANIWEDKDKERGKRLYRDAVFRLRLSLKEYNLYDIVDFCRAKLAIKKCNVQCDFWNYLQDENETDFNGKFLFCYEWSMETQERLTVIRDERLRKKNRKTN